MKCLYKRPRTLGGGGGGSTLKTTLVEWLKHQPRTLVFESNQIKSYILTMTDPSCRNRYEQFRNKTLDNWCEWHRSEMNLPRVTVYTYSMALKRTVNLFSRSMGRSPIENCCLKPSDSDNSFLQGFYHQGITDLLFHKKPYGIRVLLPNLLKKFHKNSKCFLLKSDFTT